MDWSNFTYTKRHRRKRLDWLLFWLLALAVFILFIKHWINYD